MKSTDVFQSSYLKTEDLKGQPTTVTVERVVMEPIKDQQGVSSNKAVMYFLGHQKGFILNVTNWGACAMMWGDESDLWQGKQTELFPDMTQFGGKVVPCIRMRGPHSTPLPATAQQVAPVETSATPTIDPDDEIPF